MKNTRRIETLLEKMSPPDVELPEAKAQLRRKLLDLDRIKRKNPDFSRLLFKYALGGVPVLGILLVVIVFRFIPGEMSAMERLDDLESTYRNARVSGAVHYLKLQYTNNRHNEKEVVLHQWRHGTEKLRIMIQSSATGVTLGHLIMKGTRAFLWQDAASGATIAVGSQTCADNSSAVDERGEKNSSAYSTMAIPIKKLPGVVSGKKAVNLLISRDSLGIFGFTDQDPANVYLRLKSSANVIYNGTEISGDHRELDIFQRRNSHGIHSYLLVYDKKREERLESVIQKIHCGEIRFSPDSGQIAREDGFRIEKIKVVETTRVDRQTGKITLISHRSYWREHMIAAHDLLFLNERFLEDDPTIFDEYLYRLDSHEIELKK